MIGGDREARERGDRAYYSLPETSWDDVSDELATDLRRLHRLVSLARAQLPPEELSEAASASGQPTGEQAPAPGQLAFRLQDVANRLWAETAGQEQDLRQVITTLRTALAVCWDLYSMKQAEETTVAQLMQRLREQIEDFEHDLGELQAQSRREVEPGL